MVLYSKSCAKLVACIIYLNIHNHWIWKLIPSILHIWEQPLTKVNLHWFHTFLQTGREKKKHLHLTLHTLCVLSTASLVPCTLTPHTFSGSDSYNQLLSVLLHPLLTPCWTPVSCKHTSLRITCFEKTSPSTVHLLTCICSHSPNLCDSPWMFLKKPAM